MRLTLLRTVVAALVLFPVLTAVWTAIVLLLVRGDLGEARDALERARAQGDAQALPLLEAAQDDLDRASSRLRQPGPELFSVVPVAGRLVQAVTRTTDAALAVTIGTSQVLRATDTERPLVQDGAVDLDALAGIGSALEGAAAGSRAPVAALDGQRLGGLPGPVSEPVTRVRDELTGVPQTFDRAAAGVRALVGMLGSERPRRLLVLLQNNAELRGTGGLVTVFAEVTAQDGQLAIGGFRDVDDVADLAPEVVAVPAPPDYVALWGPFLANTTLWKNANMEPDVPTSSDVLARVARASLPTPPDAVLWLDVPAIAGVLGATGPAELPDGSRLTAENAVDVLLSQAYFDAPDTFEGQAQRQQSLRAVADAVLSRVLGGAASVTALAPALGEAAAGRHVAAWSADAEEQADLRAAGLAGEVAPTADGDLLSFAVQNLGGGDREGNKLDYYARRRVAVRAVVGPGGVDVEQDVALRNTAPGDGLPVYVAGGGTPGTSNNLVSFALPTSAEQVEFTRGGQPVPVPVRRSGPHDVVVDVVRLPPGTETTWRLRYRLPLEDGSYRLTLVPQPLAVDADLSVEVMAAEGYAVRPRVGSPLRAGAAGSLVLSEPFTAERELAMDLEKPGWRARALDAVRRFWNEPVQLP